MSATIINCKLKGYIQPFERVLAIAELSSLTRTVPIPIERSAGASLEFTVTTRVLPKSLAGRLAYWETVSRDKPLLTTQVLREATVNVIQNGIPIKELYKRFPFNHDPQLPNRRCLRYGPHGIHEYRGKFFPQLVRALINVAGVPANGVVADTMCGSGTTPVEAALLGCTTLGIDLNPLSVLISRTKYELLHCSPTSLARTYERVRAMLVSPRQRKMWPVWLTSLHASDQAYLRNWFSEKVLDDLEHIIATIRTVRNVTEQNLCWLSLSNILRHVSWQKEDDLRVRREARLDVEINGINEYLQELSRSVRTVLAFLLQCKGTRLGRGVIHEGDARAAHLIFPEWRERVDAVITSPPYATALPYLDTDRLSLIYLKLLSRPEHRRRDIMMVGNREITEKTRRHYWELYKTHKRRLPGSIVRVIDRIHYLNAGEPIGFRRRNLPALLAQYFLDMEQVFHSLHFLLKRHAPAFVVIGNNHTFAGDKKVYIETAELLAELAETCGFTWKESIPMEMLVSRDIFRKNAVASETIISLRKR